MRKVTLLAASLVAVFTLCACAALPKVQEPVIVKVPVYVPCINQLPNKPVFAVSLIKQTDDLATITDAYMVERHQRIIYEAQLEAATAGCLK
ncbi:MAG TPA: hypothetical protein VN030_13805 [Cellvibrio sp.]|nr:hypothetical protein [Cellvibrio sp.]